MGNDEKDNKNEHNNQIVQNNESNQIKFNHIKSHQPVINQRRNCPYCGYLYLYSNQKEINFYNKHVNSCNKKLLKNDVSRPTKLNNNNNVIVNNNNIIFNNNISNKNSYKYKNNHQINKINNFHNNLINKNKNFIHIKNN